MTPDGKVTDGTMAIDVKSVPGLSWQVPHSSPLAVSCDDLADPVLDVEAEAVLAAVAGRAIGVDRALRVPVAERLIAAVEVAEVGAGRLAHVDLDDERGVEVRDRVVEQLDDVLRVVGERARDPC